MLSVPASEPVRRRVYDYKKADWIQLCKQLSSTKWGAFFEELSADEAAERFTAELLQAVEQCIPVKWILDKVYAHPWINDECRRALSEKHAAIGTESFIEKRDACTETFRAAHRSYVARTREELRGDVIIVPRLVEIKRILADTSTRYREHSSAEAQ